MRTGKADMDESWRERHERESRDFYYNEQQRRASSPARGGLFLGILTLFRLAVVAAIGGPFVMMLAHLIIAARHIMHFH